MTTSKPIWDAKQKIAEAIATAKNIELEKTGTGELVIGRCKIGKRLGECQIEGKPASNT